MNRQVELYLRLAGRWWWLLILGALIPALASIYITSRQADYYQARATLMVGTSLQNPDPEQREIALANTLANAYARLVREGPITQAVTNRLGLKRQPEQLAGQISTAIYPEAQLLAIMVVDSNPQAAALIANALADELVRRSPSTQEDRQRRRQFIQAQLDELELQIKQMDEDIAQVRSSLVDLTSAAELEEAQKRLSQLETARGNYQATYAGLMSSSGAGSPSVVSILETAVVPTAPLPRRDKLVIAIAAAAGLAMAVAGVVLIEYLDDSVRWEGEAKRRLLDMPVLGAIPKISRSRHTPISTSLDPTSPIAETIRGLRTNVFLAANDGLLKTLLVTSPELNVGKTFTVGQFGLAIALEGKRVVLVDADLRKPSLHEFFDLPNLHGLADFLANSGQLVEDDLREAVQDTGVENLYLLPAGRPPLDPSSLLASQRFEDLLGTLRAWADVVLIDSPPALVAPDVALLAALVDGTVMVVVSGRTSAAKISNTREYLIRRKEVKLLGVIFNRVSMDVEGYYYSYGVQRRRFRPSFWKRLRRRIPFLKHDGMMVDAPVILDLGEVADYLGVSRGTARRWCESGRLPAYKSWFRWFVKEKDLRAVAQRIMRKAEE